MLFSHSVIQLFVIRYMSMRFAFFVTPELSVEILETLKQHGLVPSVIVTNPDRPQGRKMVLTPPPVKLWAVANNIPFFQPEFSSDPDFLHKLKAKSYQLFVVVAYGSILPKELLAIPEKGSLNIHYSLLPKYRGASPIESQILADDKETGVSILLLDEEMDHGPIVASQRLEFPISNFQFSNTETERELNWPPKASELRSAMNELAGEMLTEVMPKWVKGEMKAKPQDHSKATYTKKFTKADGEINLSNDLHHDEAERRSRAHKDFLKIQAFESSIGTYYYADSMQTSRGQMQNKKVRVKIVSTEFKNGALTILRVIPEGKKEMDYTEFLRGTKP